MMASHRNRPMSPAPRVYLDPRASTSGVPSNSYDTRFGQLPRASFSTVSTARDSVSSARNSGWEAQPIQASTYANQSQSGGTISKTKYVVRPRRDSETRQPLNIVTKDPSPSRDYPTVSGTPREVAHLKPSSRDDSSRYLQPAQASHHHHHRHNSATRAELERYNIGGRREGRPKSYYHSGPYVEKVYPASRPPIKYAEGEVEYTGPREQFARDYPARPRRSSLTRRERPMSAIDPEFKSLPFKRRDDGPPPAATRQLDRIDQPDSARYSRSGFDSDPDRPSETPRRKHSTRAPILHQYRDEGYSSARDEYGSRKSSKTRETMYDDDVTVGKSRQQEPNREYDRDRDRDREREKTYKKDYDRDRVRTSDRDRERERDKDYHVERTRDRERPRDYERYEREPEPKRQPRSREASPDHSGLKGLAAVTGLGGVAAAAAVASRKGRNDEDGSESDSRRERKHRRHRSRDNRDDELTAQENDADGGRNGHREHHRTRGPESSGSDTPEDQGSHRRRSSKRRHQKGIEEDAEADASHGPIPIVDLEDAGYENPEAEVATHRNGPPRDQDSPTDMEGRTLSPGEGEDGRPRRVTLVEPLREKGNDTRPKGILKPPRAVPFPEDPNPTREGVAPLKAAGKDGIPAEARWTKINRLLVNPEALEKAHERFEERDEYVVVLRVLKREEIEKLAEKTREIRENRERMWQQQLEERRKRKAEHDGPGNEAIPEEEAEEEHAPLAIEAPAPAPAVDLRNLQGADAAQTERVMAGALPVPEITVDHSNYSENV